MKKLHIEVKRAAAGISAVLILLAASVGVLPNLMASAAQVSTRSITIGSSAISATTTYAVKFTAPTSVNDIVFDFCSNSSIIGGSCNAPTGFTAANATFTNGSTNALPSGWAINGTSTATNIKLQGSTATTAGNTYQFTLGNITNPSTVGTFYARVYTYTAANWSSSPWTSATTIGSNSDYGGFALSTATNILVQATVMETLTFCTSAVAPANGCTSTSTPTITIGHGSPQTIDSTVIDTTPAYTQLSTNALSGAAVTMQTNNTCTGLSRDGGATCLIPGYATTNSSWSAGTADYGLNVATGTGGTGTVVPTTNYGNSGKYYMGSAVATAGGDTIETSNGTACANVNSTLTFAASASTTTPAGVYSASENLVATGTF